MRFPLFLTTLVISIIVHDLFLSGRNQKKSWWAVVAWLALALLSSKSRARGCCCCCSGLLLACWAASPPLSSLLEEAPSHQGASAEERRQAIAASACCFFYDGCDVVAGYRDMFGHPQIDHLNDLCRRWRRIPGCNGPNGMLRKHTICE